MHRPEYHYQRGKQVSRRRALLSISFSFSLSLSLSVSQRNRVVYRFPGIASWPRSKSTPRYPRVIRIVLARKGRRSSSIDRARMCMCIHIYVSMHSSDRLQFFNACFSSTRGWLSFLYLSRRDSLTFCRIRSGTRIVSFTLHAWKNNCGE